MGIFPIDIDFVKLLNSLSPVYALVITSAVGAIVALTIQERFKKLKKGWLEKIKFGLFTLWISFIVTVGILAIVLVMDKLGLLVGRFIF